MATVGSTTLTLLDWAKRIGPDGKIGTIVEMLSQTNEMLMDMMWAEGNLPTGHRTTARLALPSVAWRLLGSGTTPSKSRTAQMDEQCGMLEAWSEVDCDLAKMNGDLAAFRLSEAQAFIEAMNQEMSQTVIYGNGGTAPEEFTGLAVRYSDSTAANGKNVVKAGGSGSDNSSIWLVVWGDQTIHGIFPKESQAGLTHDDYGEQTVQLSTSLGGSRMRAYQERFQWKAGIALRDWRYVVRICNIDIGALVSQTSDADLNFFMTKAMWRIPNIRLGRPAFYVNRTCGEFLDIQGRDDTKTGGGITKETIDGYPRMSFRGVPIRTVDSLLETEETVS